MQPGQVFTPRGSNEPPVPSDGAPNPDRRPTGPPEPTPPPAPTPEPTAPAAAAPPAPQPQEGWQFRSEAAAAPAPQPEQSGISWTASEFINHEKGVGWYGLLLIGSVLLAALVYLVTHDKVSTSVVVLAALVLAVFAAHKPRTQQYGLSQRGLQVGVRLYGFQDFKTFSIIEEGAIASIVFMPLKRFMPPLTIYVAPDMEERVVNFLSAYLPFEQRRADAFDSLLRRIRF